MVDFKLDKETPAGPANGQDPGNPTSKRRCESCLPCESSLKCYTKEVLAALEWSQDSGARLSHQMSTWRFRPKHPGCMRTNEWFLLWLSWIQTWGFPPLLQLLSTTQYHATRFCMQAAWYWVMHSVELEGIWWCIACNHGQIMSNMIKSHTSFVAE